MDMTFSMNYSHMVNESITKSKVDIEKKEREKRDYGKKEREFLRE